MTDILIIFLLVIILLAVLLIVTISINRRKGPDGNEEFLNEEGDHAYYDRSIIEKKEYMRAHPDDKNVRTFGKLFGIKRRRTK